MMSQAYFRGDAESPVATNPESFSLKTPLGFQKHGIQQGQGQRDTRVKDKKDLAMASKGWGADAYTLRILRQGPPLVHLLLATQIHLVPCVPSETISPSENPLCCSDTAKHPSLKLSPLTSHFHGPSSSLITPICPFPWILSWSVSQGQVLFISPSPHSLNYLPSLMEPFASVSNCHKDVSL